MTLLGNGLWAAGRHDDRLAIVEVQLATQRRVGSPEEQVLTTRSNLAHCLYKLERLEESIAIDREVYAREKKLYGPTDKTTIHAGNSLVTSLNASGQYAEAKAFAGKLLSKCRRALGSNHVLTLNSHAGFAEALYGAGASRGDILQAVAILEDVARARRRALGEHHPTTARALASLERARMRREDVAA